MAHHRFPTLNNIEYAETYLISDMRHLGSAVIDRSESVAISYIEFLKGLAKIAIHNISK